MEAVVLKLSVLVATVVVVETVEVLLIMAAVMKWNQRSSEMPSIS